MKVSSRSLDPSQNSSHVGCISFCSFVFSLISWQRKASCYCPAIEEAHFDYSQSVFYQAVRRVKMMFSYLLLWNIPFHYQIPDQGVSSRVVAWQCLKPRQLFYFSVGLPSMAFGWLGDVGCPGHRALQLHTVYKQSWDFSGFQFLLDMSVLFALIKIPMLLAPPHDFSPFYLYCPDHIPV